MFTNIWDAGLLGIGKARVVGKEKERVALIKSLIYARMEKMRRGTLKILSK